MNTYIVYKYCQTDHLDGGSTEARYTALPGSPESSMGYCGVTGEPVGITVSRGDARPAYVLKGDISMEGMDGHEYVLEAGKDSLEPLDVVMNNWPLRADMGVSITPIDEADGPISD